VRDDQCRLFVGAVQTIFKRCARTAKRASASIRPDSRSRRPGNADYREEKIDLPASWLRGFMQIQSAMGMPMRKVSLTRDAVYSLCAYLKRHKARSSPRALRFEFVPGKPVRLLLEPWEQEIVVHGKSYDGPPGEPVRVWGKQRLLVLARLLPLLDGVECLSARHGPAAFLGRAHGRNALDAWAVGVDHQRLDALGRAGSACAAGRGSGQNHDLRRGADRAAEPVDDLR